MTRLLRAIRRRWWILLLVCVVWVLGAWFAAASLIVSRPFEHADVIVVLSGSGTFTERTNKAAQLYRAGVARTVIITNDNRQGGWSQVEQRNPYYYERAMAELLMEGVSAADIVMLPDVVPEGLIGCLVPCRNTVLGCALEDEEVFGSLRDDRDGLHA